ncbi:hypothetical protein C8R44DRAFT_747208 [Mycena epipterygia]|nr:hypothetical protein C8R44DRAFT_887948 [Mycena epipterygia]KAJ7101766.1 hypothetical protein C8R44DRAFT_747208 [Mycena epipterygia]
MKFYIPTVLAASSILFSPGALAAMTPNDAIANIRQLTTVSSTINSALVPLGSTSTVIQITAAFQICVQGFTTIVNTITTDVSLMSASPPLTGACDAIVVALVDFVRVHQALLATVFGKHSIAAQFGLTAPIAEVLQLLEAAIDSLAYALILFIPCAKDTVVMGQTQLDASVQTSITLYQQICIPSLLYPYLPPICVAL